MAKTREPQAFDESQTQLWLGLRRVYALVQGGRESLLRRFGLTISEFQILYSLYRAPNGCQRMSDLSSDVHQSRSRTTHAAQRLESQNYLVRNNCAADRRGVMATITDEGKKLVESILPLHETLLSSLVFDRLTGNEISSMTRILDKVDRQILTL